MRFAEIVLRVGASLGAWMIFIGYALTLAVLPRADCDPTADTLWRGTLMLGVTSALALAFAGTGLPWREQLRWVAALGMAVALWALIAIAPALRGTTISGDLLCASLGSGLSPIDAATAWRGGASAPVIERLWGPVQCGILAGGVWQGLRYWLIGSAAREAPTTD